MEPRPQSVLDSLNQKGIVLENKGTRTTTLEAHQRAKLRQTRRKWKHMTKTRRVMMNRRRSIHPEGSRRGENGIERRVQTLKRLIPTRESKGLEGLFRDTADYIISLQARVRLMQHMVDALASSQDHH